MARGEEIVRRTTTKRYQLGVICGPYLDIALKKIRKKLDWIKFSEKFLTGAHDIRYYHFDHYLEDFRGSSYIGKLESLNFKIITKRLPPLNKEIIKELIGVEISSDICFESAAQQDSGIWIKIVCPFKELTYSLTKVSKIGAKVTLIDFSSVPKDLVAVASELIILSENENIFLE